MNNLEKWLRWALEPRVLAGTLVVGTLLMAGFLATLWLSRPVPAPLDPPTAVVNRIPAPTPTLTPTSTATPEPTPTPTLPVPPAPPEGSIVLGGYVQVAGTGGDGLRLRADASLKAEVRMLGAEAEIFLVKDGPRQVDGFTWWYLEGPYDPNRHGWAVSNYLAAAQQP